MQFRAKSLATSTSSPNLTDRMSLVDSLISGERIFSKDHFIRMNPELYEKIAEFFSVPIDQIDCLRPYIERAPMWQSLRNISYSRADRVLPERILEHLATDKFLARDEIDTFNNIKVFLKEEHHNSVLTSSEDPSRRIKLFPFTGQRANWNKTCPYKESPLDAEYRQTYAIYLPDDLYRELEPYLIGRKNDHVTNAFAYLHYYEVGGYRLVSEIQSDIYGRLTDRGLRERYKHWAEVLLLSFQHEQFMRLLAYALTKGEETKYKPEVTVIVDSEWVKKRWPLSFHAAEQAGSREQDWRYVSYGIAGSLADRVYEKVPEKLGFEKKAFPMDEFEKTPDGKPVELKNAWVRITDVVEFQKLFFDVVSIKKEYSDELDGYSFLSLHDSDQLECQGVPGYFSTNRSLIYRGKNLTDKIKSHLEWVPQIQIKLDAEPWVTQDMLDEWKYCLKSDQVKEIAAALNPDFTWLSKGEITVASSYLWTGMNAADPDGTYVYLDSADSDTPAVKLGDLFLITDGAGLRKHAVGDFHSASPPGSRHVFNLADRDNCTAWWTDSSVFKGYVKATLYLRSLLRKSGVESPNLPIPLDIGLLSMIPVWHGDNLSWHVAEDYNFNCNKNNDRDCYQERNGSTYRYLEPCHIQFKTWLESLGNEAKEYGTSPAESLRLGLRYIYAYQGHQFKGEGLIPENFRAEEDKGLIANRDLFKKLAEIDPRAANEVFTKISSDLFYTFGVLHGAGGDFSSCWRCDFSLAGTFHAPWLHLNIPQIGLDSSEKHIEKLTGDVASVLYAADILSLTLLGRPDENYTRYLESIGRTYEQNLFEGYLDFSKYYSESKSENVNDFFTEYLEPYMPLTYLRGRARGIEIKTQQQNEHLNEWEW